MRVLVKQGDTIDRIALRYMGSADQADLLYALNNLEYPGISGDPNFQKAIYAIGQVQVTALSAATVEVGQEFQTGSGPGGEVRTVASTQSATLSAGQVTTVNVQATVPGHYGNLPANTIATAVSLSSVTVTNPSPITGGRVLRVLIPGDFITIPDSQASSTAFSPTQPMSLANADAQGGVDLLWTPTGGLVLTTDDLVATSGADTIAADIGAVIATPLGSVSEDPLFGSLVPETLGGAGDLAAQRIAVLAQGAANADSRVQSAGDVSIDTEQQFALITMDVVLATGPAKVQAAVREA